MRVIELTKGQATIVDDEDFERLAQYRWHFTSHGYARRSGWENGKKTNILMHRIILGDVCAGMDVDHINGNRLDNRRCNLRPATRSENCSNVKLRKTNTTGVKGVSVRGGKFIARIGKGGKIYNLGTFASLGEATEVYNKAAEEMHGSFARLN